MNIERTSSQSPNFKELYIQKGAKLTRGSLLKYPIIRDLSKGGYDVLADNKSTFEKYKKYTILASASIAVLNAVIGELLSFVSAFFDPITFGVAGLGGGIAFLLRCMNDHEEIELQVGQGIEKYKDGSYGLKYPTDSLILKKSDYKIELNA